MDCRSKHTILAGQEAQMMGSSDVAHMSKHAGMLCDRRREQVHSLGCRLKHGSLAASGRLITLTMTSTTSSPQTLPLSNEDPSQPHYDSLVDWMVAKLPEYVTRRAAFLQYVSDVLAEMDARFPGSGPGGTTTVEDRLFRKQVCTS
jgi:hypothetical protein